MIPHRKLFFSINRLNSKVNITSNQELFSDLEFVFYQANDFADDLGDGYACGLQFFYFRCGCIVFTPDDGTGMPHAFSFGCGKTGHESDDRFFHVIFEVFRGDDFVLREFMDGMMRLGPVSVVHYWEEFGLERP